MLGQIVHIVEQEGDCVIFDITADCLRLRCAAEIEYFVNANKLILHRFHVHGGDVNLLGAGSLRKLILACMKEEDLDEVEIRGAHRTTGAAPGRTPRPLRFRRR